MLVPKRVKHRKQMRGRMKGKALGEIKSLLVNTAYRP